MMPITLADAGEEFTIQRIAGKPEIKAHLADLGFVVGGNAIVLAVSFLSLTVGNGSNFSGC